ncbi:MAG: 2-polyprenyl-6-methoxyphenol hydroxylase-like FAD-dependent oxidoreductase [Hyphomicrobiaceae bacterium]|jgi:2-polyprenyl-6-methoxyphenol hydroxylase-like FAD-dependent oxidoreductase
MEVALRILIVGAGPTGLTAGVELARRNIHAEVIDRRDEASPFSRAVGILPRSLKTLEASGVTPKLLKQGQKFRMARFYRGDRLILSLPLTVRQPLHGYDFILGLAQDRTEAALRDAFVGFGGAVSYGTELMALRQERDGVIAETSEGKELAFDYVIGADGVRSKAREELGIAFDGIDLPETWSIADVDAEDWPNANAFTVCQLPGGEVAVVAPLDVNRYRVISNTEDALAALPLPMNVTHVRREGQFKISVRQVSQYSKDRVFLAGDAAHCHSPVGGRGMNLGIADAADLAARFAEGAIGGYSAARHAGGARVIAQSEQARKVLTSANPIARGLVLLGLRLASVVPPMQRAMSHQVLYGE